MCPMGGGNWNNASLAGSGARNLNNVRGNSNTNYGLFSDSVKPRSLQHGHGGPKGDAFRRAAQAAAKSVGPHISSSNSVARSLAARERQVREFLQ